MEEKNLSEEKLVRCRNCANYPNSCGYYTSKNLRHTCPDKGEGQHGFKPSDEMNLKDTIDNFYMYILGADKNAGLLRRVLYYLKEEK